MYYYLLLPNLLNAKYKKNKHYSKLRNRKYLKPKNINYIAI